MRNTITFFISLLLCASLTADASQEDQLMRFIESKAIKRQSARATSANGPEETDPWADPGSFSHLPTKCPIPPAGTKAADKIMALPGQPPRVNFDQYSGYVMVSEEHFRELFYYFVEAPYEPASKPLILWLNGGPGCSSLGYGAMTELGPFRVNPDGKTLSRNKHAWNNLANVIFLESPAGVGFSYASNDKNNNNNVGDRRTAEDTFVFLLKWLERFPEYKGRDFYIAGESYGGHYVPQLATVIKFMNELHGTTFMNLRGIFVGNPYLDDYKNEKGNLEFLWSHGVISDQGWAGILDNCTFSPSDDWQCFVASRRPQRGDLDPYNIYAPLCLHAPHTGIYYSSSYLAGYDPCAPHYVNTYLNNLEVLNSSENIMRNTPFCFFLLICVAAWHADASQQAQLREFILSRRSSSNGIFFPWVATNSLRAESFSVTDQTGLKDVDKIAALPGQPNGVSFSQYSGYVTVDENNGRALFYYLVEAATDPPGGKATSGVA
ncbi:hypothetical protein QYE76_005800 [Lolium multiflorum]|uniref:Carboxypeptidase n=1 Tax=Lolium multiflorum TaxID=4521 RepID=A0AAD8W135_LOLMU|nr:hypothetical protein QYE76_005800 [Lolium multiflorum]